MPLHKISYIFFVYSAIVRWASVEYLFSPRRQKKRKTQDRWSVVKKKKSLRNRRKARTCSKSCSISSPLFRVSPGIFPRRVRIHQTAVCLRFLRNVLCPVFFGLYITVYKLQHSSVICNKSARFSVPESRTVTLTIIHISLFRF